MMRSIRQGARRPARCALATGLLTGAALAALVPGMASAQAAQTPTAAPPADAATSTPDIVVTAQRREQKLKDVGIAITVLDKDTIKNLNITNATDIVRAIPNLRFNAYASSQVVFNMRGVAQNDYGDEQEPPVAVYQDDSYSSSMATASFPVFDLARTEALRGPQGTLFGRNATGGAVQFISTQPKDDTEGYVSATFGSYNQATIEGALQGQVAKDLDVRISGIFDRDDGYLKDVIPDQPNRGGNNHWALRGIVKWSPSTDFTAKLTLRYTESDHERQGGLYTLSPACPNAQNQGVYLPANVVCPYWAPNSSYNQPGYAPSSGFGTNTTPGAIATGYYNQAVIARQGGNPWEIAATGDPGVDRQFFGGTLRLDAKAGLFDITSISDYQYVHKLYNEMGDGQPEFPYVQGASYTPGPCPGELSVTCYAPATIFSQLDTTNQFSEELHAATTFGKNYLVFGAFGMTIESHFGAKYATPFDEYDPQVAFYQHTTSFAFFAQDEYKITDDLKFIGGIRYWQDRKLGCYNGSEYWSGFSIHYCPDGISFVDPTNATQSAGGSITASPADAHPTFRGVTARAELDYKPSVGTLIYISYNRGSKSGGFTFSTGTPTPGQAVYDTINGIAYRPEVLDDYEIGVKASLPAHSSFNIAAYYYDYHNYQAFVQVGYTQEVRNLPAVAGGIEAEFSTHPIRGLTLNLSGSWEESHVHDVLLPDDLTIVTHDLPQAPHWSGNALVRYEFDTPLGLAGVQADSLYQSHMCFSVMCAPVEQEGAYHVENARISLTPKDSAFDVAAYVNNVFNRAYRLYAYDASLYYGNAQGIYAKPRTWGVNIRYHF
ncbi:TonB-dependent receptor [Novosphingobium sp. FSW06-99]|uniref:TonB-dependent receptor n=1 Tax=Novosphingobium sp. FSW06-99 TaxID=1739113 RepID=UPI00076D305C|nr:TonB-dependent receptor [Novosphingobium sp. FSW06-99]KUR74454.1 TonB-dependent receptor [Novosphingobium sp. FSW06-99]